MSSSVAGGGSGPVVLSSQPSSTVVDGSEGFPSGGTAAHVEAAEARTADAEARTADAEARAEAAEARAEAAEAEVARIRTEAEAAKKAAGEAEATVNRLKDQIAAVRTEAAKARGAAAEEEVDKATISRLRGQIRSLQATIKVLEAAEAPHSQPVTATAGDAASGSAEEKLEKMGKALHSMRAHLLQSRKENTKLHAQLDRFLTRDSLVDLHNRISQLSAQLEEVTKEKRTLESALRKATMTRSSEARSPLREPADTRGSVPPPPRREGRPSSRSEARALRAQAAALRDKVKHEREIASRAQTNLIAAQAVLTDLALALRDAGESALPLAGSESADPAAAVAAVVRVVRANAKYKTALDGAKEARAKTISRARSHIHSLRSRLTATHTAVRSLYRAIKAGGLARKQALDPAALVGTLRKLLVATKPPPTQQAARTSPDLSERSAVSLTPASIRASPSRRTPDS
ncbi:uncharacterized protein AMSG_09480 [Thecamonas trahens ATCC 50062]|uniref:Uncharacterized protein n=1 Tax=Thecamonas trahens ATCC 50062 TaxID=461836 RepID=A0A0L0DN78_THETB|nr:hypothetical protein AMSG_09480 [Thecamonas trahens ATCC 50062]KNC53764.1 hypothetical protein AMSG_09480 [Thecamonas trahens ATCC 50062]|eukprot:XP_013754327.1 hypothetical protein AMSG_09480 [Thecamonas trahens ATCC 50062]